MRLLFIQMQIPKAWGQLRVFLHGCAFLVWFVIPIGDTTVRGMGQVQPPYFQTMFA